MEKNRGGVMCNRVRKIGCFLFLIFFFMLLLNIKLYSIKTMEKNRGGGMCNRVRKIGCFLVTEHSQPDWRGQIGQGKFRQIR